MMNREHSCLRHTPLFLVLALFTTQVLAKDYYKCDGGIYTDQPWNHQGCRHGKTKQPYAPHAKAESPPERAATQSVNLQKFTTPYSDAEAGIVFRNLCNEVGLNIKTVQYPDGRSKGGDKVMLISYIQRGAREKEQLEKLATVFRLASFVNTNAQAPSDAILITVGDSRGNGFAAVGASRHHTQDYAASKELAIFVRRWSVGRFSPSFLPLTSRKLGW